MLVWAHLGVLRWKWKMSLSAQSQLGGTVSVPTWSGLKNKINTIACTEVL